MEEAALKKVRFSELLGQERAREALVRSALSGRLPHAYLFCGLEGTGRRTAARMLAALLGCQAPHEGEACGEGLSCRKLAGGSLLRAERLREDGFWERRRRLLKVSCMPASVSARLELAAELWPSIRSE